MEHIPIIRLGRLTNERSFDRSVRRFRIPVDPLGDNSDDYVSFTMPVLTSAADLAKVVFFLQKFATLRGRRQW